MKNFKPSWACWISLFLLFSQIPNLSTAETLDPESLLSKMSLEQKVGQLFLVGFPQTELDQKLKNHIQKNKFGAFLLFKRNILNPQQVVNLNKELYQISKNNSGVLPLISVDQEGGFVNRIPIQPSTPHAISVGLSKSVPISLSLGQEIGRILFSLGFNMNLAPVLDLASAQKRSFISVRSFGADPTTVGSVGAAYSLGLIKNHVVPTAKHFPGLGDSLADPHVLSVVRKDSAKMLLENDLVPFKMYSSLEGEKAIMLSHMVYPQLDEEELPASFSKKIIQHWLRKEIGFDGVVMTDDLHMKASTDQNTVSEGAFKALRAGVDMVMLSWSFTEQEKTVQRIISSYKNLELPMSELNEKVLRILKLKKFIAERDFDPTPKAESVILSSTLGELESKLFTSKLEQHHSSFLLDPKKSLCVYSSQGRINTDFKDAFKFSSRTFLMHPHLTREALEKSISSNSCQLNILTVYSRSQAQLAISLSESVRKSLLVLNMGSVALLRDLTKFLAKVDGLSSHPKVGQDLALYFNDIFSTSLQEVPSQHELAQSRDVEAQSSRRPSSQKPISSRPQ